MTRSACNRRSYKACRKASNCNWVKGTKNRDGYCRKNSRGKGKKKASRSKCNSRKYKQCKSSENCTWVKRSGSRKGYCRSKGERSSKVKPTIFINGKGVKVNVKKVQCHGFVTPPGSSSAYKMKKFKKGFGLYATSKQGCNDFPCYKAGKGKKNNGYYRCAQDPSGSDCDYDISYDAVHQQAGFML
jgi:hypothetical protein